VVPDEHPEVKRLQAEPDRYLAALRYLDLELERLLDGLRGDGLLRDTAVLVLGDHGRHERTGGSEMSQMVGRFMAPLIVWLDESLRSPETYRPRTVTSIASQVDLVPTILALNGATPEVAPFLGRDLSCALVRDCLEDNVAYLSSVYDDVIGLADRDALWTYSFRRQTIATIDHALARPGAPRALTDPEAAARFQQMLALYVHANLNLERNRIWGKELGERLRARAELARH
jgi:arylsulfatase A-like enzyme